MKLDGYDEMSIGSSAASTPQKGRPNAATPHTPHSVKSPKANQTLDTSQPSSQDSTPRKIANRPIWDRLTSGKLRRTRADVREERQAIKASNWKSLQKRIQNGGDAPPSPSASDTTTHRDEEFAGGDENALSLETMGVPNFKPGVTTRIPNESIEAIMKREMKEGSPETFTPTFTKAYLSVASQRLLTECFWYIFLHHFRHDVPEAGYYKSLQFDLMSAHYRTAFLFTHEGDKDLVMKKYPDVASQTLYSVFYSCFPFSRKMLDDEFKKILVTDCTYWFTGMKVLDPPVTHWHQHKVLQQVMNNYEKEREAKQKRTDNFFNFADYLKRNTVKRAEISDLLLVASSKTRKPSECAPPPSLEQIKSDLHFVKPGQRVPGHADAKWEERYRPQEDAADGADAAKREEEEEAARQQRRHGGFQINKTPVWEVSAAESGIRTKEDYRGVQHASFHLHVVSPLVQHYMNLTNAYNNFLVGTNNREEYNTSLRLAEVEPEYDEAILQDLHARSTYTLLHKAYGAEDGAVSSCYYASAVTAKLQYYRNKEKAKSARREWLRQLEKIPRSDLERPESTDSVATPGGISQRSRGSRQRPRSAATGGVPAEAAAGARHTAKGFYPKGSLFEKYQPPRVSYEDEVESPPPASPKTPQRDPSVEAEEKPPKSQSFIPRFNAPLARPATANAVRHRAPSPAPKTVLPSHRLPRPASAAAAVAAPVAARPAPVLAPARGPQIALDPAHLRSFDYHPAGFVTEVPSPQQLWSPSALAAGRRSRPTSAGTARTAVTVSRNVSGAPSPCDAGSPALTREETVAQIVLSQDTPGTFQGFVNPSKDPQKTPSDYRRVFRGLNNRSACRKVNKFAQIKWSRDGDEEEKDYTEEVKQALKDHKRLTGHPTDERVVHKNRMAEYHKSQILLMSQKKAALSEQKGSPDVEVQEVLDRILERVQEVQRCEKLCPNDIETVKAYKETLKLIDEHFLTVPVQFRGLMLKFCISKIGKLRTLVRWYKLHHKETLLEGLRKGDLSTLHMLLMPEELEQAEKKEKWTFRDPANAVEARVKASTSVRDMQVKKKEIADRAMEKLANEGDYTTKTGEWLQEDRAARKRLRDKKLYREGLEEKLGYAVDFEEWDRESADEHVLSDGASAASGSEIPEEEVGELWQHLSTPFIPADQEPHGSESYYCSRPVSYRIVADESMGSFLASSRMSHAPPESAAMVEECRLAGTEATSSMGLTVSTMAMTATTGPLGHSPSPGPRYPSPIEPFAAADSLAIAPLTTPASRPAGSRFPQGLTTSNSDFFGSICTSPKSAGTPRSRSPRATPSPTSRERLGTRISVCTSDLELRRAHKYKLSDEAEAKKREQQKAVLMKFGMEEFQFGGITVVGSTAIWTKSQKGLTESADEMLLSLRKRKASRRR